MIVRWWMRASTVRRCVASVFALADVALAVLCLAAFDSRGPGSDTGQWALGWLGLWLMLSAALLGVAALIVAANR